MAHDTPPTAEAHEVPAEARKNFIEQEIDADLARGANGGAVHTRVPPEPNGYLHIGHAKSICLNYGLADKYGGLYNLRFDDTNPTREETEFVDSIQADIRWLGFDWQERLFFASDYFEQLYRWAEELIEKGLAYVCDLTPEQTREYRGNLTEPGTDSPFRERDAAENLDLLRRMRAGEFPEGSRTLRAKIDMASPNMVLRDPVLYRILHAHHHRTGDAWCIYPTYDWAHGQSDAIEGITHSICTLEFENHRPLYEWFLEHLDLSHLDHGRRPRQIEFSPLSLTYTVLSKRRLRELVEGGHVAGWDDPRLLTLSGMRRRGYTPEALRAFCDDIGVTKFAGVTDMVVLENHLREDLNRRAQRRMAVLRPLKVTIANWPEGQVELVEAINNPGDEAAGTRQVPLSREIWIERDDFREEAPRKFFRLAPGREVRLRYGYAITCTEVIVDPQSGEVSELVCTYDPETSRGQTPDGRKIKGILHWVSAAHALDAEVRLYDHLVRVPDPLDMPEGGDFKDNLNPSSLEVLTGCKLEPSLAQARPGESYQFERTGYFCVDSEDSAQGAPVFNRSVSLRDSWAKIEKRDQGGGRHA